MVRVIKRDGTLCPFDSAKIISVISKAGDAAAREGEDYLEEEQALKITENVIKALEDIEVYDFRDTVSVEEISDLVEKALVKSGHFAIAKRYITYRFTRALARRANTTDEEILKIIDSKSEEANTENSNKDTRINSTIRDYMAGEVSKDLSERILLPEDIVSAHREGIIHFHDTDYFAQHMHNCDLVNLEDMLQNGTVITGTMIERPNSFLTACNIATQIVAQVASSQYGGQTISLAHLAPFVNVSRKKYQKEVREEIQEMYGWSGAVASEDVVEAIAERRLRKEVAQGVQTIQYQLVTLMTTNGQTPFVSVMMFLKEAKSEQEKRDLALIIEETLKQRIKGLKNEKGVYVTPAFPKLLYVLEDDNTYSNSEYYYLTELAAKCTAKRMVPDYISEKVMKEMKDGDAYPCMGCRSFLTVDRTPENVAGALNYEGVGHKYYGRFNQGVVTLNLVDIALSSKGDFDRFWEIMEERLQLCHKALRIRHERLLGTKSDVAPILWQHGALARLQPGETIDKLLYGGYSTISLGYGGLYECVYYMTGKSHTDAEGKPFAMAVMQALNDACSKWRVEENIDYSVYGTPMESTTYKFAKCLQKRFGIVEGVTDHDYITNSYHISVREEIDAFQKLAFESEFQKLSPGGAISYVEVPNLQDNIPAVIAVVQYIYETIMYAELNTKSDLCLTCGYDGEIQLVDIGEGKIDWKCPNCGERDHGKIHVARRTCGYIGSNFWNQGRTWEIKDRVLHLGTN